MDVVRPAQLGGPREEALRMDEHPCGALDQRLEDERGDLVRIARELGLEPSERCGAVGDRG